MKALVYDQYTTDDDFSKILKIKDIPSPKPKHDEVIFKVKTASLNYDDTLSRHPVCNLVMLNSGFERPSHWTNDRRFFFKYMNRATGRIVLENRTLRWSTPGTLNDPYDMQFDLHIDIEREAVKVATLQKLWDAFYGDQPVPVGNILGAVIQSVRGNFPQLTREEFDREYGDAIDDSLSRMERAVVSQGWWKIGELA